MVLEFVQNNLSFVIFILILSLFLYMNKRHLALQGSFPLMYMLLYRTRLGLGKMKKWSAKHPKIFLYLSYLSWFIGVVGSIFILFFMIWQLHFIVDNDISSGGGLVLPIQTDAGLEGAVPIFYVPFWYWLIALFVLIIVHEFAHGVIAERFNIRIKSSGLAFFGIVLPFIPGAFVEPDEKQLAKKPRWQQIAVMGAGSTSNFIFGFLFLAIWIFGAGPFIDTTMTVGTIGFTSVMNESSLAAYNLDQGQVVGFNGVEDREAILEELFAIQPNEEYDITINSSQGVQTYSITTFPHELDSQRGMIGIAGLQFDFVNKQGFEWLGTFPLHVERLLFYIWFLNIAIGLMNLLPLWITDGGQIVRVLFEKFFGTQAGFAWYNRVSLFSLILIIFTVWPGLMFSLLKLIGL